MGHLVRLQNIAKELIELAPDLGVFFVLKSSISNSFLDPRFCYSVAAESDFSTASHVQVFDTMLTSTLNAESKNVLVLRKCKPKRHKEIVESRALNDFDLILIPHLANEFGRELPSDVMPRVCFSGPIVKRRSESAMTALQEKYGINEDEILLVSAPGGGGFTEHSIAFFEFVCELHRELTNRGVALKHLAIKGPRLASGSWTEEYQVPGLTWIAEEPDFFELIHMADVVASAGGYNTVNEIQVAKKPAIFFPGDRTHDDQYERVGKLQSEGKALVVGELPVSQIANRVVDEKWRTSVSRMYLSNPIQTGNRLAAEKILRLLSND